MGLAVYPIGVGKLKFLISIDILVVNITLEILMSKKYHTQRNGLNVYTEDFIKDREYIVDYLATHIERGLRGLNRAITFHRIETSGLIDQADINSEYDKDGYYSTQDNLALRPETTAGSYGYAQKLLQEKPSSLPLVVWQFGKSFRHEQDKVTENVRLKEFYQLEFQLVYAEGSKADYHKKAVVIARDALSDLLRKCNMTNTDNSDRLPAYSEKTVDVTVHLEVKDVFLEVASISKRTDFDHPVVEIAIGVDRVAKLREWSNWYYDGWVVTKRNFVEGWGPFAGEIE